MQKYIIFWLDYPLLHVAPLIASVASSEYKVIVVCENNIPQWRLDMGFHYPDFGNSEIINEPSDIIRNKIVSDYSSADSVHVFHGLRSTKKNLNCFKVLGNKNCSIGLYFEYLLSDKLIKTFLRFVYYRIFFKVYNKKIKFMLALGDSGRDQYVALGLPEEKVFSFNYYIEDDYVAPLENVSRAASSTIKVLFVGQLVDRKNVLMLVRSFREIANVYDDITLTIVGEGDLKSSLREYVEVEKIKDRVEFLPYSSNHELKGIYSKHDIFILPSKWEGWGAVAVEAMAHSLAVIISDKCGSACIVQKSEHGIIFDGSSELELTEALRSIIEKRDFYLSNESKIKRLSYANKKLSAKSGKVKLLEILKKTCAS